MLCCALRFVCVIRKIVWSASVRARVTRGGHQSVIRDPFLSDWSFGLSRFGLGRLTVRTGRLSRFWIKKIASKNIEQEQRWENQKHKEYQQKHKKLHHLFHSNRSGIQQPHHLFRSNRSGIEQIWGSVKEMQRKASSRQSGETPSCCEPNPRQSPHRGVRCWGKYNG